MCTTHLPTVHVSVVTTRCQYQWGEVGPQANKFGNITYPIMHLMLLPPPHGQTDSCENITFPQLRLWAVIKRELLP